VSENADDRNTGAADHTRWDGTVAQAFANQIDYCHANDATITVRMVSSLAVLLDDHDAGAFIARLRDWQGHALADGLPLRAAGALHGLYLAGAAPELATIYLGLPAGADDDVAAVRRAVLAHAAALLPWLDGPPQTNEAGRSSNFVAAMLWLAARGLPARFECLEIGSSAGVNLMIDRYHYDLGGVVVAPRGEPALSFAPEWRGPPPPDRLIVLDPPKGCDVAPLDLTNPADVLRLKAFVWPEHRQRFARLEAAVQAAGERRPDLVAMRAADFVERELARPQAEGTTRVLMHSIVWQYLPADEQARIEAAMTDHGARATPTRALAWIALEANRSLMSHGLVVRYWPGGAEPRVLAAAHAHGSWVEWRA
jgi:hypothetical protein